MVRRSNSLVENCACIEEPSGRDADADEELEALVRSRDARDACAEALEARQRSVRVHVEHDRRERDPARIARHSERLDQPAEGHLRVLDRVQHGALHLAQVIRERALGVDVGADREAPDAMPRERGPAHDRLTRGRQHDDERPLARDAMDEGLKAGEEQRGEARALCGGHGLEARDERLRQVEIDAVGVEGALGRAGVIQRQLERGRQLGEALSPELEIPLRPRELASASAQGRVRTERRRRGRAPAPLPGRAPSRASRARRSRARRTTPSNTT